MFRVCAFAPANIPICAGMLMTPATRFNVLFWQWVNQTYNAGFNYSNRNASGSLTNEKLAAIYTGASAISCGLAVGLGEAVKRAPVSAATAAILGKFVPYCAVASSNVFNFMAMRSSELVTGIPIKDKEGAVMGMSQEAAKVAIFQGAVTRAVIPAPVLILPPIVMRAVDKLPVPARFMCAGVCADACGHACVLSFSSASVCLRSLSLTVLTDDTALYHHYATD